MIFFSFLGSAQKRKTGIYGKVTDQSGAPIYGATVLCKGTDIRKGVFTNESGEYSLELPEGKYLVIYRFAGFETDTLDLLVEQKMLEYNVQLYSSYQELEEVDVKVGRFDKPLSEQTVSLEVIRAGIIEDKNTRSVETILDQTPGLNILDGEPQIRGGSGFTFGVGAKVAVLVDDMPMLSGDAGRPEWEFIPIENIHQIEVTKGAVSVLSGSSALAGSIHIRTAYPKPKPLTKVNSYCGFYSEPAIEGAKWWNGEALIYGVNFIHTRRIKNFDLVLGGNMNYDHGYIGAPRTSEFVNPDTVSNFSDEQMSSRRARFNFNTRYRSKKIKGLNYGVNGNIMLSKKAMVFAWLDDSTGLFRAYPGAAFLNEQVILNIDPHISLLTNKRGNHKLRFRVLYSDNKMTGNQSNTTTTYYGNYNFKHHLKQWGIDLETGIMASQVNSYALMYKGSGSPYNQLLNTAFYLQTERKFWETLTLSSGARLEYFQLNDSVTANKPIFRVGASFKLHKATFLRASFGQGFRFPTITERFILTGVGNFGVFPNPNLKPESSWNTEIGVKQGIKIGKLLSFIDLAVFRQEYENTIEYLFGFWGDPSVTTNIFGFKFVNTGKSRVMGLDISFAGKADLSKKLSTQFMIGYNYIMPKTLEPDYIYAIDGLNREYSYNSTSLDSTLKILKYRFIHNLKGDMEFTWNEKLSIGFSVKYFSKIENLDGVIKEFEEFTVGAPYIQDIEYMDFFNSHRFGNWIYDARISWKFNKKHKVALIGTNITNLVYSLRPLKIETPRTIMLQYTYKLDKN